MLTQNKLLQFAGVPVSGMALRSCYDSLKSPSKKIQAQEQAGELVRLKRDMYIVNRELFGKDTDIGLCANHLYGPSYVSLQWALRYYGLIPEMVHLVTSTTIKRSKQFQTPIGNFSYYQVPTSYFPIGVSSVEKNGVYVLIASREKALCDTILHDNFVPNQSVRALSEYLEEDLRIDMDELKQFDTGIIEQCSLSGRKSQIFNNLIKIIKK